MKLIKNPLILAITFVFIAVILFLPFRNSGNGLENQQQTLIENIKNRFTKYEPETPITLLFGGDVMLGRTVMTKSQEMKDFNYPFLHIATVTSSADITLVNLENPIVTNCPPHYEGFIFCTVPEMAGSLAYAGIDIVNLANNHTLNYGQRGFDETKSELNNLGVSYVGDNNLIIKKINDKKIGFLGFDFLTNRPNEQDYNFIIESAGQVDMLVVTVHWGVEYQPHPADYQKEWARKIIESGADIIVGHHPHVIQDIEYIDGKPVYYSLGNLVFDQMWSEKTRQGLLIKLTIDKDNNIISEEKIETYIDKWAQPILVTE